MKKILLASIFLTCLFQASTAQYSTEENFETFFTYGRKGVKVDRLTILPPIASIYEINDGNKMEYDSVLSLATAQKVVRVLRPAVPDSVYKSYLPLNYALLPEVKETLIAICNQTVKKKQARDLTLPDSFMKHFDTAQERYILCFLHSGFSRTERNFEKQGVKNIIPYSVLGIVPIKNKVSAYCCIFDLKNRNLVYFCHGTQTKAVASEEYAIRYMVSRLVKAYFF